MPKGVAEDLLADVRQYFDGHSFTGFPSDAEKKVVALVQSSSNL